jgi:hypothetical protein
MTIDGSSMLRDIVAVMAARIFSAMQTRNAWAQEPSTAHVAQGRLQGVRAGDRLVGDRGSDQPHDAGKNHVDGSQQN